ncbi:MAG TPA: hypothetical protein VKA84_21640 [Gemmatimonadaceae bacterium]|nr:hypothetical protein [Gemmatimonadaceae bacterium]
MTLRRFSMLGSAVALLAACGGDPTPPENGGIVTADLQFIRPAPDARPLVSSEVSFWAKKGEDSEGRLYRAPGTSETDDFVRLRVRKESLLARPDGTLFATGDSVLITLKVIDPENLMVEMSPSGLTFNPTRPAELKFEFNEADDDLNRDGTVNGDDNTLKTSLQIWKRESASEPWTPIVGTLKIELEEIEANLLSFTTYAIAYRSRR